MLIHIEPAEPNHAADLAILFDIALSGVASHRWSQLAGKDHSVFELGKMQAQREDGAFSYRNSHIARIDQSIAGMLLSYQLGTFANPEGAMSRSEGARQDDELAPLLRLEQQVQGSRYINSLAVYNEYRKLGVARLLITNLLDTAEEQQFSAIIPKGHDLGGLLLKKFGFAPESEETSPTGQDWQLWLRQS